MSGSEGAAVGEKDVNGKPTAVEGPLMDEGPTVGNSLPVPVTTLAEWRRVARTLSGMKTAATLRGDPGPPHLASRSDLAETSAGQMI